MVVNAFISLSSTNLDVVLYPHLVPHWSAFYNLFALPSIIDVPLNGQLPPFQSVQYHDSFTLGNAFSGDVDYSSKKKMCPSSPTCDTKPTVYIL